MRTSARPSPMAGPTGFPQALSRVTRRRRMSREPGRNRGVAGFDLPAPRWSGSRLRNYESWRASMVVVLKRAEGNWAGDLDLTRRSIALALAGGYAVAAFSADAEPIHTDEQG